MEALSTSKLTRSEEKQKDEKQKPKKFDFDPLIRRNETTESGMTA